MDYVASAVMAKEVKSVSPSMTLGELENQFIQHKVSGFAVVEGTKFVGVVSRSDVLNAISPDGELAQLLAPELAEKPEGAKQFTKALGERADSVRVAEIMTKEPVTVSPSDHLHEVADLMYHKRIHRVFVVDAEQLVGVITTFDFVRLYSTDCIGMEGRPDRTRDF